MKIIKTNRRRTNRMKAGEKLLWLFREEQGRKGNIGCTCSDCIEDMSNALEKYKGK